MDKLFYQEIERVIPLEGYISIRSPQMLHIKDRSEHLYYGADQSWYRDVWQQKAGCGPTSASHLLWYLEAASGMGVQDHKILHKEIFLEHMEKVWAFVTPGKMGVNRTEMFAEGVLAYGKDKGLHLVCDVLDVPAKPFEQPEPGEVAQFLTKHLAQDMPVAFLNLSNGRLHNLESWHWVTLVAFEPEHMTAVMYDQGKRIEIDLRCWLETTALGGGFVAVRYAQNNSFA